MLSSRLRDLQLQLQDKDITTQQVFIDCSNLLLEANVKRVPLPKELEVCLRYRLVRYGMRHLVGCPVPSGTPERKSSIVRIHELFRGIQMQRIDDMEEHLNDDFLLRLRLIHSELLFMFGHEKIRRIPWSKMRLCLAVFLLIFKDEARYGMFKLLLLPTELVVFLRATVLGLVEANAGGQNGDGAICARHKKVFRKLRKRHRLVEELYGLVDVYWAVSAIYCERIEAQVVTEAALLHLLYKLHGLSDLSSSSMVGVVSNLSKELVENYRSALDSDSPDQHLSSFYRTLIQNFPLLKVLLEMALFLQLRLAFRCFLQTAWNCRSLQHLRLLCRFLHDCDSMSDQQQLYLKSLLEFYSNHVNQVKDVYNQDNLSKKLDIVNQLVDASIMAAYFNPSKILFLCDSNVDLGIFKHLIQLDFASTVDLPSSESIRLLWSNLKPEQTYLTSQEVPLPPVWKIFQSNRLPFTYRATSNRNELTRRWGKKMEAKFIEKCVAYDEPLAEVRSILAGYSCSSIENLMENFQQMPRHALMALDRWMLQCYSHLGRNSVNVNELALLQMGHERVHGHLLADNASFRALMTYFDLDLVLRALALTELSYAELLTPKPAESVEVVGLSYLVVDGLRWVGMQARLLRSARESDRETFEDLVRQGAEPSGKFTLFLGKFDGFGSHTLERVVGYQSNVLTPRFSETFDNVDKLQMEFFNWEPPIDAFVEDGKDPSKWDENTFTIVVQKLVACANRRSLVGLLR